MGQSIARNIAGTLAAVSTTFGVMAGVIAADYQINHNPEGSLSENIGHAVCYLNKGTRHGQLCGQPPIPVPPRPEQAG